MYEFRLPAQFGFKRKASAIEARDIARIGAPGNSARIAR
jgi:hypothetical protein